MSSQDISKFEISDLLKWPKCKISDQLDTIIHLIKNELNSTEENVLLIVKVALDGVLPCLPLCDLEDKLLRNVCQAAENLFVNTLQGISNLDDINALSQTQFNSEDAYCSLLSLCAEIISSFIRGFENISIYNSVDFKFVRSIVKSSCAIIRETCNYNVHINSKQEVLGVAVKEALMELFALTSKFLAQIVLFLSNNIKFKIAQDDDEEDVLFVVSELRKLSIAALELDVKVMADAWKAFLMLSERFSEILMQTNDEPLAIKALCKKIINNFEYFLTLDNSTMKLETNILKITSFLLKIVIKLCSFFSTKFNEEHENLLMLLFQLYRATPSFLHSMKINSDVIADVNKLLVIGANPLLNHLYKERAFIPNLQRSLEDQIPLNPYGTVIFLLSLLKKLLPSSHREQFLTAGVNLLEWMFTAFSACHEGIINNTMGSPGSTAVGQPADNSDLYQVVLVGTAAFLLSSSPAEFIIFEETLLRNVLSTDPWSIILASDLWCLVARYADASICHNTLKVIIPAHEKLDENRPEVVNLSSLITRLLPSCDSEFLDNIPVAFPPSSYRRFWALKSTKIRSVSNELVKEVSYSLDKQLNCDTADLLLLKNLCENLQILEDVFSRKSPGCDADLEKVVDIWRFHPVRPINSPWLSKVITSLSSLTAVSVSKMAPEQILQILFSMEVILPNLQSELPKLAFLKILEAFSCLTIPVHPSQSNIFQLLTSLFTFLLMDSAFLLREGTLKSFAHFAKVTKHTQIISNTVSGNCDLQNLVTAYLEGCLPNIGESELSLNRRKYFHYCSTRAIPNIIDITADCEFTSSPKRLKLDKELDLELVVERFKQDSLTINSHLMALTVEQEQTVKEALSIFQELMK